MKTASIALVCYKDTDKWYIQVIFADSQESMLIESTEDEIWELSRSHQLEVFFD